MTNKEEALRMALDALEETRNALAWFYDSYPHDVTAKGNELLPHVENVLAAIREVLEQPEQEPVALLNAIRAEPTEMIHKWRVIDIIQSSPPQGIYYTPPAQRKPLTDEEIDALAIDKDGLPNSHWEFARAIEAAHGIGEKPDAA